MDIMNLLGFDKISSEPKDVLEFIESEADKCRQVRDSLGAGEWLISALRWADEEVDFRTFPLLFHAA